MYKSSFLLASIFFLISFLTIKDYGINWDSPNHFDRGQAYLNYVITGGKTDYSNLEGQQRISYYQNKSESAAYYLSHDSAHPPFNGIMAAIFNKILYQKMGIVGDIESYHLFIITTSAFLIFIVSLFAYETYGPIASITSAIVLGSYPLFFAESHFNIKDPVETTFFATAIYFFWKSTKKFEAKYIFLSAIFCGFALGTKFNIIFFPFIIVPWFFIKYIKQFKKPINFLKSINNNYKIMLMFSPLIILLIFYVSWPFLWKNPIINFKDAIKYYYEIGTGGRGQPNYILPGGFNYFPITWVLITTPLIVLFLTIIGIFSINQISLLWLIWLIVPILRVSLPNTSIYGGVRQIMEYIPAMSLLAGVGANKIYTLTNKIIKLKKSVFLLAIVILFIPHFIALKKIHPNENVYFNSLIGGLKGAQEKNIPYWGNSFGNAYLQAVNWLNDNAKEGDKLALVQGTERNIPRLYINDKIFYSNANWSWFDRNGEYLVELTHNGNMFGYPWVWEYVDKVLSPVYEVKVDGVAIAKIWKNDIQNSNKKYKNNESLLKVESYKVDGSSLKISLEKISDISRLVINLREQNQCDPILATVKSSKDNIHWQQEETKIPENQISKYSDFENGTINYMFPARTAKYILINTNSGNSCLLNIKKLEVFGF